MLTKEKPGDSHGSADSNAPSNPPPPPPVHLNHTRNVTPGPLTGRSGGSYQKLLEDVAYDDDEYRPKLSHKRNSSSFLNRNLTSPESPTDVRRFASPEESPDLAAQRMSTSIPDDDARMMLKYLTAGRTSPAYTPLSNKVPSSPPQYRKAGSRGQSPLRRPPVMGHELHDGLHEDYTSAADSNSITKLIASNPLLQRKSRRWTILNCKIWHE